MGTVLAQARLDGVPPERVWQVLTADPAGWGAEHVLEVAATPDGDQRWFVRLNGSTVEWVQRTVSAGAGELAFVQVSGDFDQLRGTWTVQPGRLRLTVEFHLGIDGLAPLLDPIWAQSLQVHADALARAVVDTARSPTAEGYS